MSIKELLDSVNPEDLKNYNISAPRILEPFAFIAAPFSDTNTIPLILAKLAKILFATGVTGSLCGIIIGYFVRWYRQDFELAHIGSGLKWYRISNDLIEGAILASFAYLILWFISVVIVSLYTIYVALQIKRAKWEEERPAREEAERLAAISRQTQQAAREQDRQARLRAEQEQARAAELERKARHDAEQEAAFWASPEGRKVKAAQMQADIDRKKALDLANIRLNEQEKAAEIAEKISEAERVARAKEMASLKKLI